MYNPTNIEVNNPQCDAFNIESCRVGDLSNKLGYVNIARYTSVPMRDAWIDGNLYNHNYVGRSIAIHAEEGGFEIIACAQIVPEAQIMARAYRPPNNS